MRGGLVLLVGLRKNRLIHVKNSAFEVFFLSEHVVLE